MKNDIEIMEDFFAIVNNSPIKDLISGSVKMTPRATKSKVEDCIISVLDSDNAQIQKSIVNINVYVPNITSGGESVGNLKRISLLSRACWSVLKSGFGNGFMYKLEKQRSLPVSGKDEHVINNRIRYKYLNE